MENAKEQGRVPATMAEKMAWLKELLVDRTIGQGTKNVAVAILMHHNERTGQCNPSQQRLADAVGMHRPAVSKAIGALLRAGWISQIRTRGASEYRLNVERGRTVVPAEMSANRYTRCTQTDTADVCEPIQQVSAKRYTEPTSEPTRETHNLNPVPAVAPSAPVAPAPANDDGEGWVWIAGLKIPPAVFSEWERTFTAIDVRANVLKLAPWALTLPDQPKGRPIKAVQTRLGKLNEEARAAGIVRKEARAADAEAGIERCPFTGRNLTLMRSGKKSRFQV